MMKQEYKKPNMVVVAIKVNTQILNSSPTPIFDPNEEYNGMD